MGRKRGREGGRGKEEKVVLKNSALKEIFRIKVEIETFSSGR